MHVPRTEVDPQRRRLGESGEPIPESVRAYFADGLQCWGEVDRIEKRKDAQLYRHIVIALPAHSFIGPKERQELSELFGGLFVEDGFVVQVCIHVPEPPETNESVRRRAKLVLEELPLKPDDPNQGVNWHAHLHMPTRRLMRYGLCRLKARDAQPVFRKGRVVEGDHLGETWRRVQNTYFREQGLDISVDPNGVIGQVHLGPVRMQKGGAEHKAWVETVKSAAFEAAKEPELIADALTRNSSTFTSRELDRFLEKQLDGKLDAGAIAAIRSTVLDPQITLRMADPKTGEAVDRYTTHAVRKQELEAVENAKALAARSGWKVPLRIIQKIERRLEFDGEAREAFRYLCGRSDMARGGESDAFVPPVGADCLSVRGIAGAGKTVVLNAVREAYEAMGLTVIGCGPTNKLVQDMKADGFRNVETVHAALWRLKKTGRAWDANTVVIVDEEAMIDTDTYSELLKQFAPLGVKGPKLIRCGDDRQLGSVRRGGLSHELTKVTHSRTLEKEIRRQKDWQKDTTRFLAAYKFKEALDLFADNGALYECTTQEHAIHSLVAEWEADHRRNPAERRFVFAYENRYVNRINDELHKVRRSRGDLVGEDISLDVRRVNAKEGEQTRTAQFAVGDQIQFTDTNKVLGIYNGAVAVIRAINRNGDIEAQIDPVTGSGRRVKWNARSFNGFDLGYAGTIYKGQGKSFDRTYLLHTKRWQAAPSYVALTRQREGIKLFYNKEVTPDIQQLAQQMSVEADRGASIGWAVHAGAPDVVNALEKAPGVARSSLETPKLAPTSTTAQSAVLVPERIPTETIEQWRVILDRFSASASSARSGDETGKPESAGLTEPGVGRLREKVPAETIAQWRSILERFGATSGGGEASPTSGVLPQPELSKADAERLKVLLEALAEPVDGREPTNSSADANIGEPIDQARAILARERRSTKREVR